MPDIIWLDEPLEDGKEIMHFTVGPMQPELDYKFCADFCIGVDHMPGPTGRCASPLENVAWNSELGFGSDFTIP
jgi:hypothetical protein